MRDEREKKVGLYGCFGATNSQFAAAVSNDAAIGGGGGSNAAEPSSGGMKLVVAIIYHGRLMEPKNGARSGLRIFIL
jgi:hypothetical protein